MADAQQDPSCADPHVVTSMRVRGAANGEAESLDWVVRRLAPLLLASARHRLGPQLRSLYDPEDLVAEAWLVALPRLRELGARGGRLTPVLLKFLCTTMVHQVNRLLERHILGKPLRLPPGESVVGDALAAVDHDTTGVVTRAVRDEHRLVLMEAIEALPAIDREVLLLRGIEQGPVEAVAAELGIPAGTVAVRYHRALRRLRAQFPASVAAELLDLPA